ncbi:MAG: cell division protein FtsH, partial [Clostridium baratii]|nr:cell division protein FtsH [Clostridium baratii]
MLGGRAAEEEVFNLVSTGASNDIERATQTARSMVTVYGMTDTFDMMALESIQNRYLDGRAVRNCSEETSTLVDKEVLKIIREAHNRARMLLKENRDLLDKISNVLLDKETIFGDEFMEIVYEKYPEIRAKREAEEKRKEKEKREARIIQESKNERKKEDVLINEGTNEETAFLETVVDEESLDLLKDNKDGNTKEEENTPDKDEI